MSEPLRLPILVSVRWYNACAAYAVELAHALARRGHRVPIVVQPGSPAEREASRRGLDVVSRWDLTSTSPAGVLRTVRGLRNWLLSLSPHAVNAHRGEDHALAAAALRGTGIPLIRTRGDVRPPRTGPGHRILYRRWTAAHVAAADFMPERFFAPLGLDASRVEVIRPGLDGEAIRSGAPGADEARIALGLDRHALWLGVVGRRTRAKGLLVALRTLPRLPSTVHLLLCGEPTELDDDRLHAEASRLGVAGRLVTLPRLDDVRPALRALDVLLIPSLGSEAITRIGMEGLALGVPVVASAVNALPELVDPTTGSVVPPGDPEALAAGVTGWMDPDRRGTVRTAGPERIRRRYDRSRQVELTESLVRRTIHGEAP